MLHLLCAILRTANLHLQSAELWHNSVLASVSYMIQHPSASSTKISSFSLHWFRMASSFWSGNNLCRTSRMLPAFLPTVPTTYPAPPPVTGLYMPHSCIQIVMAILGDREPDESVPRVLAPAASGAISSAGSFAGTARCFKGVSHTSKMSSEMRSKSARQLLERVRSSFERQQEHLWRLPAAGLHI